MGTFYRSRHELVFVIKHGTAPHINSFELGQHGRYRTNVWLYKGANTFMAGRQEELALHPTVKPVQMIADAIKDVSGRGDIVLDIFWGSGSTLIAAQKMDASPIFANSIQFTATASSRDMRPLRKTRRNFWSAGLSKLCLKGWRLNE